MYEALFYDDATTYNMESMRSRWRCDHCFYRMQAQTTQSKHAYQTQEDNPPETLPVFVTRYRSRNVARWVPKAFRLKKTRRENDFKKKR